MSGPRIVIVGAGFAGYRTARTPARPTRHKADFTLLDPTGHFLYLPLLPAPGVAVGAGRTGTEAAAQGQPFTDALVREQPPREGMRPRRPLDAVPPGQAVQPGLVRSWAVPLDTASPEPPRVAGSPGVFASRPEGES